MSRLKNNFLDMEKDKLQIRDKVAQEKRQWVRLTRVCNNNCLFCLDKENQNGEIIPFRQVIDDFKNGRKEGATRAILSGGEPTLHPQLIEIIKKAKKFGYSHIQMISNGRMLAYEDFVKKLKEAGLNEITLSLHSHLKDKFEEIVQAKGSYNQAIKGLLNALKHNLIVSVDIVINKINYKTLKDTLNFFIKLGVTEFDLLHLVPFGNAWSNRKKIFYSPRQAKKYLDKAFELFKNKNLFIWTNRLPAIYLEGYEELIQHPIKLVDEVRGMENELRGYIGNNKTMFCFGKRCDYCFMNGFCSDLIKLKKEKILKSKSVPFCFLGVLQQNKKSKIFKFKKNVNLYKFLDFYIKYRYFVKSFRCKNCRYFQKCDGANIEEIRIKGFRILKPFLKKQ